MNVHLNMYLKALFLPQIRLKMNFRPDRKYAWPHGPKAYISVELD